MAHMLTQTDHAMYGRSKPAWHGLGTVVSGYQTSADAQRIARLDWTVRKEPAYVRVGDTFVAAPDAFLTTRSDLTGSDRVLGIVGPSYTPIQNTELFDFLDVLAGEGGAKIDTAGSLKGGKLVWALAKLPDPMMIGNDRVERHLLVSTAHDGSSAMEALITPIRVVCWNTLSAAIGWRGDGPRRAPRQRITIRHTANARDRIADAKRVLGDASGSFEHCREVFNNWASKRVSRQYVGAFLRALVPDPGNGAKPARAQTTRNDISELYRFRQIGADMPELRDTAWGLYNALTQYIDRERATRGNGRSTAEARLESTWYGSGAALRQKAATLLTETLDQYADFDDSRSVLDLIAAPPANDPSILDGIEVAKN